MVSTRWRDRPGRPACHVRRASPQYWQEVADWLRTHHAATPTRGVLVVVRRPATQVWGTSHDEPAPVTGPGVRDSIPLTLPQTIRALDLRNACSPPDDRRRLADTLPAIFPHVLVRNDLDPETSRSARPILLHRKHVAGVARQRSWRSSGAPVGPAGGLVNDSGLRPRYPAIEIYSGERARQPRCALLRRDRPVACVDGGT